LNAACPAMLAETMPVFLPAHRQFGFIGLEAYPAQCYCGAEATDTGSYCSDAKHHHDRRWGA
jgi:hypothetical protein